jgi:hypothetical protein
MIRTVKLEIAALQRGQYGISFERRAGLMDQPINRSSLSNSACCLRILACIADAFDRWSPDQYVP